MEDTRRIDEYWEAYSKFGDHETPYILSELWGWSLYRVQRWIQQGEDEGWL